jgi:xylan 1,4-beta-xylosidase
VEWSGDGWLRLASGGKLPELEVEAPNLTAHPFPEEPERDDFNAPSLNIHWHTLRVPADESWLSLQERAGHLRLRGRESLYSLHRQSMVARRIQSLRCVVETCVEFEPVHFSQMAGLVLYYDEQDHYYLRISHDERLGKHLAIIISDQGQYDEAEQKISIEGWERCCLKASMDMEKLQFRYSRDGLDWHNIGPVLYTGLLADEYKRKLSFTGAFAGLCAQDLGGAMIHADFDYFDYRELFSDNATTP